jgi:hypothetical protein
MKGELDDLFFDIIMVSQAKETEAQPPSVSAQINKKHKRMKLDERYRKPKGPN